MAHATGRPFKAGEADPRREVNPGGRGARTAIPVRPVGQAVGQALRADPETVRDQLRQLAADRVVPFLEDVLLDRRYRAADKLKAAEIILRNSLPQKTEMETRSLHANIDLNSALARALYASNSDFRGFLDSNPELRDRLLPPAPGDAKADLPTER